MKKTNILLPISIVLTVCIIIIANLYTFTKSKKFKINSSSFKNNQITLIKHPLTKFAGDNLSIEFELENVPKKTKSFALIGYVEYHGFFYRIIHSIPFPKTCLNKGIAKNKQFKNGITQENNSLLFLETHVAVSMSYLGYNPQSTRKNYSFRLYALKKNLKLEKSLSRSELMKRIRKYIIGKAVIKGVTFI